MFVLILNYYFNYEVFKVAFYTLFFVNVLNIDLKDNINWFRLRKTSTIMYFTHMIFYFILSLFIGFEKNDGLVPFVIVLISTLLLSIIINVLTKKRDYKIIKL